MKRNYKQFTQDEDDGDDNAWIFSYSDMISLVLGFFVIMFSMSTLDEDKLKLFSDSLKDSLAGKKKAKVESDTTITEESARELRALKLLITALNIGMDANTAAKEVEEVVEKSSDIEAAKSELLKKIKKNEPESLARLMKGGTKEDEVVMELVLPSWALFPSGSDELNSSAKKDLRRLANMLASVEKLVEVEVVGHTDSRPPGTRGKYTNNWALSAARAGSVAKFMVESGLPKKIIRSSGQADLDPLFPEVGPDGRWLKENMDKNRRVNVVVRRKKDG